MEKVFTLLDEIFKIMDTCSEKEMNKLFEAYIAQKTEKKPKKIKITDEETGDVIATVKDKDVSKCDSAFGFAHACVLARTKSLICKSTLGKFLVVDAFGSVGFWTPEKGFYNYAPTLEDILDAKYDIVGKIGF